MKQNNKRYAESIKNNYTKWKKDSLSDTGYFVIFKGFMDGKKLKDISGNALKLYLYLGLNSNTRTGEVWHSNSTIAKYFDRSERTVRLWMQELESLNLIKRFQLNFNEESHTFLQPYYNQGSSIQSTKYVYQYRLKNLIFREAINLESYKIELYQFVQHNFKNVFIEVKDSYFNLVSYTPIDKKILNNLNKMIKDSIPELNKYSNSYNYLKKDGTIGTKKQLFERVKLKR